MLNSKNVERLQKGIEKYYTGVVEDHEDPLGLGRLRVRIPELYGSIPKEHIPWANPCSPFGGAGNGSPGYQEASGYGFFFIPVPGSKVKVRLWRGHPWFPEWYGTHWFRNETPDEAQLNPPHNYVLKTPKGNLMDFHDDKPYMRLKDRGGNFIVLDTATDTIGVFARENVRLQGLTFLDMRGELGIRMSTTADMDITIGGNLNIDAQGLVNINGAIINLNGPNAAPPLPENPADVDHLPSGGEE